MLFFQCVLVLLVLLLRPINCLIAYDCAGSNLNFTTVNLRNVAPCEDLNNDVLTLSEEIQLLESTDTHRVKVSSCLIEITRYVAYCGHSSHNSIVQGGMATYVYQLGRSRCIEAHTTGSTYIYFNPDFKIMLTDLKAGNSVSFTRNLAGMLLKDGTCDGAYFTDSFGSWSNVVATGSIRVTLSDQYGVVDSKKNAIHLNSGIVCAYTSGECSDSFKGESYWYVKDDDNCHSLTYRVLYEGIANVTRDLKTPKTTIGSMVSVEKGDIIFNFRLIQQYSLCHLDAYVTDHPKLIIIRKNGLSFYHRAKALDATDLDMFTYVNSKFLYIERNIEKNFKSLYNHMKSLSCENRYKTLTNSLAIAMVEPNEFAYIHNNGPGSTGRHIGEVIYVTKCQPVLVTRRETPGLCFSELPVLYKNESYYMKPKYHTLMKHGTEVTCSPIMPPAYLLEQHWFAIMDVPLRIEAPITLDPNADQEWSYYSPSNLMTSGVYTLSDLDKLREHIMYGDEHHAISNLISRSYVGLNPALQGGDFSNFLTEQGLEKITETFFDKMWGWFSIFGNFSAGMIGLMFIIQTIKWVIGTLIHGKALYDLYGCGLQLLGSVWESATMCLIHKANQDLLQARKDKRVTLSALFSRKKNIINNPENVLEECIVNDEELSPITSEIAFQKDDNNGCNPIKNVNIEPSYPLYPIVSKQQHIANDKFNTSR